MSLKMTPLRWAAVAAVALLIASAVRADLITPVGVAGSSFYGYGQHPLNIINDASVTSASTSLAVGSNFWHAGVGYNSGGAAPVVANQSLIFTLPGVFDLTQADIWQMNQSGLFGRGIKNFNLLVSSDGVNYTTIVSNGTLAQATGAVTAQTETIAATGVRFVKLQPLNTWNGTANDYVGLNEFRVEGTQVSAGPLRTVAAASTSAGLPEQPSSIDLLQGKVGTSSLGFQAGNTAMLTDGIGSNSLSHRVIGTDTSATTVWHITYDATSLGLNVGDTMKLNKINVFGYNTDGRRILDFDVEYTLDGSNWQYLFIGAATGNISAVTLASLAKADLSYMAQGVRGLRFDFRPVDATLRNSALIEIDAFGVVIPTPAALPAGLGPLTLVMARRKSGRR
ncbi:MAG: hypothetical protein GC162_08755 [Planctomycetes bacterium]|nr:hypothetical protein [Planctomycetota bacterium]